MTTIFTRRDALRMAVGGAGALVAQTRGDVDVLVTAGTHHEILRQAACPVLVLPAAAHVAPHGGAQARR